MENIKIGFEIMGMGMLGIFVAIIIIMIGVVVMQKIDLFLNRKKNRK